MKNFYPKKLFAAFFVFGLVCQTNINAQVSNLVENFDGGAALPTGWSVQNLSSPLGINSAGWNLVVSPTSIPPYSGTNCLLANFNAVSGANTISAWIFTPQLNLTTGGVIKFWTRAVAPGTPEYPDRLQVRMSLNGASTNAGTSNSSVGDFTTLLFDINPGLLMGVYPKVWTEYTINLTGITGIVPGRIAFRYFVADGGPDGNNSDQIGLDNFSYASAPAPVVLFDFGGTVDSKNQVSVLWKTASENNNSHFSVERSLDGINFSEVGKVTGKGNSSVTQVYSFFDENSSNVKGTSVLYYRLKQVDLDGKFAYSQTVQLKLKKANTLSIVNFTIKDNSLQLQYNSPASEKTTISIFNTNGQRILTTTENAISGINTSTIMLPAMQSGVFIVELSNGTEKVTKQIMK